MFSMTGLASLQVPVSVEVLGTFIMMGTYDKIPLLCIRNPPFIYEGHIFRIHTDNRTNPHLRRLTIGHVERTPVLS
jgi:hypothetical protein